MVKLVTTPSRRPPTYPGPIIVSNECIQSIPKLPSDCVVKILELLDAADLRSAFTVCKEWNRLITNNPNLFQQVQRIATAQVLYYHVMTLFPYKTRNEKLILFDTPFSIVSTQLNFIRVGEIAFILFLCMTLKEVSYARVDNHISKKN